MENWWLYQNQENKITLSLPDYYYSLKSCCGNKRLNAKTGQAQFKQLESRFLCTRCALVTKTSHYINYKNGKWKSFGVTDDHDYKSPECCNAPKR